VPPDFLALAIATDTRHLRFTHTRVVLFQNAVLFQSFKTSERMLQGTSPSSPSTVCAAGAMAGLCQSLVSAPVDLLKTLSQCGSGKGPYERGTDILRAQGVGGLYRTWGITAMRECPSFAVYFSVYHALVPRTPHAYDAHTSSQGTRCAQSPNRVVSPGKPSHRLL
jgi:hypothetical protein